MPYNVLLLPLLGGFLFVNFWHRTKWHAHRAEKDRLLIYAAISGLFFLILAFAVRSFSVFEPCYEFFCLTTWWDRNIGLPYSGVSMFAFLLGAVMWFPANRLGDLIYWREGGSLRREWQRVNEEKGGPLEQLLLRAMQEDEAVMLSLKNGKVYIGGVSSGFVPREHLNIHLVQTKSGYRDQQQRLNITTHYDNAYKKIRLDYSEEWATRIIDSFGIIVPVSEVASASLYLPKIHAKYFHHDREWNGPLDAD